MPKENAHSKTDTHLTMRVVDHFSAMIEDGRLHPGDQIPPERDLARSLKMSRASLRAGIGYLAAMGVMNVRHGVGTFVADGPPELGKASISLMGALHGFQPWQMFEARKILEGQLAALAAERGTEAHFTALAEELAEMYATINDPAEYLIHDVRFHRMIAKAAGNPILAALMETVTSALYDDRRKTAERSRGLKQSADLHKELYRAMRAKNSAEAQALMEHHLSMAQSAQDREIAAVPRRRVSGKSKSSRTANTSR